MSDRKYIFSTLASSVEYPAYAQGGGDLQTQGQSIVIQGGANIPDKYMRTPEGAVVTPVSAAELEALEENPVFQLHKKNGYITVHDKNIDGEKAAADMEGRDTSAPLVDQDFVAEGKEPPIVKKPDEAKPSGRRA